MLLPFYKYQGAGNDFVMVDQRTHAWLERTDHSWVAKLCDRHFGIGADGLILLQNHPEYDFEMVYFNADGRESTMCGNGGRCIVAFAHALGIHREMYHFIAIDGPHQAIIKEHSAAGYAWVELKMSDVNTLERHGDDWVIHTGSPHYVHFSQHLAQVDMVKEGRKLRYSPAFEAEGINVNFAHGNAERLQIRTYERGVEDETLACGTGVTATALALAARENLPPGTYHIPVQALGGDLSVQFNRVNDMQFTDIWLNGPAQAVFSGTIEFDEK